ncbi:MAG: glutamate synthase large subunit [Gemmatales bacterium]|nr:glutamate synthase large subunit [Gemmatales bacterium]MDW7994116.1 glutamate synthase large subunit [Gemmatales bacterium]
MPPYDNGNPYRPQGLYDPQYEHDACGVGFLVDVKNRRSHQLIRQAIQMLLNLEHRGACGCEENTGDGAGILVQMPHRFLARVADELGIRLPPPGFYGVGMVFLPTKNEERLTIEHQLEAIAQEEGQTVLGWRTVPTDNSPLGQTAKSCQPVIRQVFISRGSFLADELAFERKLFVIRKRLENWVRSSQLSQKHMFYIPSLSHRTIVYKGMLKASQLATFYPDLSAPDLESALAMVHSRFSTNTFPSWSRAHPYRYLCHNGEINTLRGNVNWMHARQTLFASPLFGDDIKKVLPVIDESGSDSAMFDNALEMLVLAGRSLPHAVMMMIPEPWSKHESMSETKRAFYEYHACLMEPWDGPACIAFTDGSQIGAVLDRNGLRPSRYYVLKNDLVLMASEVGVLDVPAELVAFKGRVQPGRMLLIDLNEGRIIPDEEIKERIAREKPYADWLRRYLVPIHRLPAPDSVAMNDSCSAPLLRNVTSCSEVLSGEKSATNGQQTGWRGGNHEANRSDLDLLTLQRAFGYTMEDLRLILVPMARDGVEPVGSMGTDTPLAVLSNKPQLLYNYFKQLFAQVTNPPIDAIREEIIVSEETTLGAEGNLLDPQPESCRQVKLPIPILTEEELMKLQALDGRNPWRFKARTLRMLYRAESGGKGLERALEDLCTQADQAIREGCDILILSDRGVCREWAAIPALLATGAVHHYLIRQGTRTRCGLVVDSGEPREVHHFSLLIGYGAGAICPYLAYETVRQLVRDGWLEEIDEKKAVKNYIKAVVKGIVKVMSKMGISTIQSYRGAQIFEAIGLGQEVIDKYFTWTASRLGGIGLDIIAQESLARHREAFPERVTEGRVLDPGGQYQYRKDGEFHLFNPETVHKLQYAVRNNDYKAFKEYSALIDNQEKNLCTLRSLLKFKKVQPPVPLDEVEPVENIMKRFKTGAMSYGSISKEAHEALAIAMNRIGGKSNTGEGGEDPERYKPLPNGDSKNSAIKQVASGRFGVTSLYLVNAQELQIKIAQGAKPGEGGQLPGHKVYPWIAKVRHSTPGVGLISPPPHHDIYSIEDLAQLIYDLKNANHHARISVKLVAEVGVGTIAAGVAKGHADVVLISGHDGGTGASPLTSIKHAGIPWELGLAETHQILLQNNLRSRIIVEVDGQLKTGRDVVIGALLGAEEFGFATAPLVALGCIMMRVCHLNTCPVGVATQDPRLREKFMGKPEYVVNFMRFVAQEVREYMAELGFRKFDDMVGRSDLLEFNKEIAHAKAKTLDYSAILYKPQVPPDYGTYCQIPQNHGIEKSLDWTVLLDLCKPALEEGKPVRATLPIRNVNRTVGTILGSEITRKYGESGLPEDTITLHFQGSAGQSFGAFIPRGLTLILEGDANDYIGKGLSGGKIIVYPPRGSTFEPEANLIIGNVAFYGATSGEAYIYGMAGERFCVRNSGVRAVVEAVGDHGCEYMTGGRVVVLGPTGRNFAAGMSGGIAYVLDETGDFANRCNLTMVQLFPLEDPEDIEEVREMIRKHAQYTGSKKAWKILALWEHYQPKFIKVYPNDYRRVIEAQKRLRARGLPEEEVLMAAFEENARDLMRVGGN